MDRPLPPLRERLRAEASRLRAPLDLVERDYALGHVLAALFGDDVLCEALVFKGGTALKKAYFGDYRFSVDLDFTAVGGPRGGDLEAAIASVAREVAEHLTEHGPFTVTSSRRPEQRHHPAGQEAFRILIQYPWQRSPLCSVKLEITVDEPVLLPVQQCALMHGYGETLDVSLRCYSLEEIVAEKLRTLLQAQKRLEEGRWLRDCARDYYDLWSLCVHPAREIDFEAINAILGEKCARRGVAFTSVDDFFPPPVVAGAARQWDSSLGNLVRALPAFPAATDELKGRLGAALALGARPAT